MLRKYDRQLNKPAAYLKSFWRVVQTIDGATEDGLDKG